MMADDAPSWLSDDVPAAAPASSPSAAVKAASQPKSSLIDADGNIIKEASKSKSAVGSMLVSSGATATPPPKDENLPKIVMVMRLANMGVSIALITCSILYMISLTGLVNISAWVLSIYATCGGILVCCLETQLKFVRVSIALNFGFLFSAPLRFLFYFLMACVCWTYRGIFGYIVAIALVVVALFNTYILCRYPGYRAIREKNAEEEDKRLEAKISAQARKQAMKTLRGG
jgi:hypothetical protein